jgi:hypothetical protein
MPKSTFFTGQPIFNQLLSYIPSAKVDQLTLAHNSNHYCKKFKTYDHLVTMLFCCFHRCTSLRELITGIQVNAHRLKHLGMVHTPRRSTLADANERRSADFLKICTMNCSSIILEFYRTACLPANYLISYL